MQILKLAARNLFRHGRRTLITGIAIAVGLAFYIFIDSLLMGWYSGTEQDYIDYEVASGRIVKKTWWEEKDRMPLSQSIEDTEEITSLPEELGIEYTPRTEFGAELIFYKDPYPQSGVYPARVVAVDPERDAQIFQLIDSMQAEYSRGEFPEAGDDGVVVGNALADKLDMEVGYPIRLQFTGKPGYEEILDTRIVGIVKSESNMVNLYGVFITLDTAEYYLQMDGAVTGYAVKVPAGRKGSTRLEELRRRLPGEYQLLGYEDLAADFMSMQQMEDSYVYLFYLIIFIIAAVGVSNTMMMAIFERRREVGMMRAQGFSDRSIRRMFFLEAGGIGLIGTAAGLLLGALINIPLVNRGMNYGMFMESQGDAVDFGSIVIDAQLKGVWSPGAFVTGGILAILVSSLVAWFPIHRLLKKSIPDNLMMD